VWTSVGAEKYIAALVHIEVNDLACMDTAEQVEELVKEIVRQLFEFFDGPAFYVSVDDAGLAVSGKHLGYAGQIAEALHDSELVVGQDGSEPGEGQSEEMMLSAEL
jgi:hypothetical protein